MKKVGILTFHYADNYGAVLQAYALRKVINGFEDCQAEIINYVPSTHRYRLYRNDEESRKQLIEKRKRFERFLGEHCGINSPMISIIEGNEYDYYCVGSDQVWNFSFASEEYLLPHLDDGAIRIAYAVSVGMNVEKAYEYKDLFVKHSSKFKNVSLREHEQVQFIEKMSKKKCLTVVDPTLLLEAKDYDLIISETPLCDEPFIFFFWLQHDDELMKGVEFVNTLSRKYNLPIKHSIVGARPYMFNKDIGSMMYEGVENFLWYVKNASFVVTNSYHATLFSIQYKRPFYVFMVETMRSRIDMLVEKYEIDERVVEKYLCVEKINDNVNFFKLEEQLKKEKESSIAFLKESLDIRN